MKKNRFTNSTIYLVSLLVPVVVGLIMFLLPVLALVILALTDKTGKSSLGVSIVAGISGGIMYGLIFFFIFLIVPILVLGVLNLFDIYRMWDSINDGKSRMTPGKAIGFMFIPFFSIYWIFKVWGGFPTDYNEYVKRYNLQNKVPQIDGSLHTLLPILSLTTIFVIPIPVLMIVFYFVLQKNNLALLNLKNAVSESRQQFAQNTAGNPILQPQMNIAG
jgi:hypothetical protein